MHTKSPKANTNNETVLTNKPTTIRKNRITTNIHLFKIRRPKTGQRDK